MIRLVSSYKSFDVKQQKNTFMYYNHIICKFLKKQFEWFSQISKNEYDDTIKKIRDISSDKSKEYIEPYYTIYTNYLTKYSVFKKGNIFIDCGCAPGGFLRFAKENQMKGYGITLQPSKANRGLELKYDADVIYGDLLDENFLLGLDKKIQEKVDFVNMGAVLYDKTDDIGMQNQLLLNQFYVAHRFLKPGGSIMFVLDIFYTLFNLIMITHFFIRRECIIHFIPVQPTFQTTQVYVLIEGIPEFTDVMFQKFMAIKQQGFVPISNVYKSVIRNLFENPYFDIESFKEVYLVGLLSKSEVRLENRMIVYKLLPTMVLDILTKSNYNLRYTSYQDFIIEIEESKIYDREHMRDMYKVLHEILRKRKKFILANDIPVDAVGNINVKEIKATPEFFKKINAFVNRIVNVFIVL